MRNGLLPGTDRTGQRPPIGGKQLVGSRIYIRYHGSQYVIRVTAVVDLARPDALRFSVPPARLVETYTLDYSAMSGGQSTNEIMGWSFFCYSVNTIVGGWCQQGTHDYARAFSLNGHSCWVEGYVWPLDRSWTGWASDSPYDCSIRLHYGIGGFTTDVCNWEVFANL